MFPLRTKSETALTEHMDLLGVFTLKRWFYGNVMTKREDGGVVGLRGS